MRAAQGEVGDVDGVLAEDGADAADDAGDVVVADGDEGAVERGFDVDAVVGEQARRGAVEDGGGGAGVAVGGVEDELEDGACAAGGELLLVFLDADAALGGDGGGVDAVDVLPPSVPEKMPAMAALRMRSVLPAARRPV